MTTPTATAKTRSTEEKTYTTIFTGWLIILAVMSGSAAVAIVLFVSEMLTLTDAVTIPVAVLAAITAGVATFRILKNQAAR